jgi:iron(II)-dependent oxidoreductase
VSLRDALRRGLDSARERTLRLTADLDDGAIRRQHHPELSPIGWHLGHVAWNEATWIHARLCGDPPPEDDSLYSSFVSRKAERAAQLPRGDVIRRRAAAVRERTLELLERADLDAPRALWTFRFVANHERQHAETIACARLAGALALPGAPPLETAPAPDHSWLEVPGGTYTIGTSGDPQAWDNERPAHPVELAPFRIARHAVTCGDWLAFMGAGGYRDDRLWTAEGRAFRDGGGIEAPEHWRRSGGGWRRVTLGGERDVVPSHPVAHVSLHEALAFARFAGARLPSEAEWEAAVSLGGEPAAGNVDLGACDTTPCGARPAAASALGLDEPRGNVWEWTADAFAPYPGFASDPYEGYSVPWFDGKHHVLRGAAWCTQAQIGRPTFRNWFHAGFRSVPCGLRLAR